MIIQMTKSWPSQRLNVPCFAARLGLEYRNIFLYFTDILHVYYGGPGRHRLVPMILCHRVVVLSRSLYQFPTHCYPINTNNIIDMI